MVKMSDYFIVEYCYKYIRYYDLTYADCAEILKEDFGIEVSAAEVEAEFEEYSSRLQAEKNLAV